jgi:uncharacterized membrane protein
MKVRIKAIIEKKSSWLPVIICFIFLIGLIILPTGYEDAIIYQGTDRTRAEIIATDNSNILSTGLIQSGEQICQVKLSGGRFKGQIVKAVNILNGSLEQDKIFAKGDCALVVISYNDNEISSVSMIDHFRIDNEIILAAIFLVVLILFAGRVGIRALLSFAVTILIIWKLLIPGYLKGNNPIVMGLIITLLMTVIIIFLVYGFDRRALSAISGALLGTIATAIMGILFTDSFQIHGAVMPYSESLLYSGYVNLDLTKIFMSSVFLGSSGAVMDLAVDITAAVYEVVCKKPDIKWKEAALSGVHVGKAAIGTMTTTLLLAYSGGYVTLLMVFMAQGTPIYNILNYKYVSSEILDTMIGSIGLVTVAPFTALTSGYLLTFKNSLR